MTEQGEFDYFGSEANDYCGARGRVRNAGPWIGAAIIVGGALPFIFAEKQLYGFGICGIIVGFIVFGYSVLDNKAGIRNRDELQSNVYWREQ